MMARILLVDDDADLRSVLCDWLRVSGFAVDEAPGVSEAVDLVKRNAYDLVVTDLAMPGMSGLHLLEIVKELDNTVEVIFLSGQGTMSDAVEALREGRAFDFLSKPLRSPKQLKESIEKALARRRRNLTAPALQGQTRNLDDSLTAREIELAQLLASGLANLEIADRLGLSEKTIKNNLSGLYQKLGVSSRTQAINSCRQQGLIP